MCRWYRLAACGIAAILVLWGALVPVAAASVPQEHDAPLEDEAPPAETEAPEAEVEAGRAVPAQPPADATPSDLAVAAGDACTSWAELQALMADETVSSITLGADIVVDEDASIAINRDLTVEMGSYGLDVEAALDLNGDGAVHFVGEGAPRPLIRLTTGEFNLYTTVRITASADGATALLIEADRFTSAWQLRLGPYFNGRQGLYVTADGEGATAIHTTGTTDLDAFWATSRQFNTITISAARGTGILCEDTSPISLAFCRIDAGVASVVTAGPLILDGSALEPQPQATEVSEYTRVANWSSEYDQYRYGVWTRVGEPPQLDYYLTAELRQFNGQICTGSGTYMYCPVTWAYDAAALAQPGTTTLSAVPTWSYQGMAVNNLAHGMEHHLTLHVVEPDKQYLVGARPYYSQWGDDEVTLYLMEPLAEDAKFTLRYREAGQEAWQTAAGATLSGWYPDQISVTPFDLSVDAEFQLEVDGVTTSTLLMPGGLAYYTGIGDVPTAPEPGEPEPPDAWQPPEIATDGSAECTSQRDLTWLAARPEVTRIVLTENVTITHPPDIDLWSAALELGQTGPLTVNTGDYGLILRAGVKLADTVTLAGNGSAQPLLTLEYGGMLTGSGRLRATASGNGAVAVRCASGLDPFNEHGTFITATGVGAVALEVTIRPRYSYEQFSLRWVELAAPGAKGVALRCTKQLNVTLKYCHITGAAASVQATGGEAVGCALVPVPANMETKKAYANWGAENKNRFAYGVWTLQGEMPELPSPLLSIMYMAEGDSFSIDQLMDIDIVWEYDEALLDTVGTHVLSATPSLPVPTVPITPLEHGKTYKLALHVVEPGRQYLTYACKTRGTSFNSISLTLMRPLDDPAACRLWYRTDSGAWESLPLGEGGVEYVSPLGNMPPTLSLIVEDFSKDYEFRLEVTDEGRTATTNTLEVPAGEAFFLGGIGGDRDGSDRENEGGLPAEPGKPKPDTMVETAPATPVPDAGPLSVRTAAGIAAAPADGVAGHGKKPAANAEGFEAAPDQADGHLRDDRALSVEQVAPGGAGVLRAGLVVAAMISATVLASAMLSRWQRRRRG